MVSDYPSFLGSPGACACSVYQAVSPHPPLERKGLGTTLVYDITDAVC